MQPSVDGYFVNGSSAGASVDGSCSCTPGTNSPDMWLCLAPTTNGVLRAYTAFITLPQPDWVLSIHSGCPGTIPNEIACDDNSPFVPAGGAQLQVELEAGSIYWLRLGTAQGGPGAFTLYLDFPIDVWPLHDDPSSAVAICPGFFHDTSAGADSWDPMSCIGGRGLWYRYQPAQSGTAIVDLCTQSSLPNAVFDSTLAVFHDTISLGCADDSCMYQASLTFPAMAGQTYLIRASDYWDAGGDFNLRLQGPPAAENDCTSLPPLQEGLQLVSLIGAIANGSSACDAGTEPDMSYAFGAPTDGTLTVTTCGTSDGPGPDMGEDTLLSIHSACPPSAANTIACNDNASPPCAADMGVVEDASVETVLVANQRVVVRITRAGPQTSEQPIVVTATFRPGIAFCAGDGSASACPCGNTGAVGHGCAHSSGPGAQLQASGTPSVSADTLRLDASSLPATAPGLYIQGTTLIAAGAGAVFGDGLRCVGGNVVRLAVRTSSGGASHFGSGDGSGVLVSVKGAVPPVGGIRHYQLWFRDAAPFCTSSAFNLSNALSVQWMP